MTTSRSRHQEAGSPSVASGQHAPMVVRASEAEHLPSIGHILLADSSATQGALSSHRVQLGRGADGAVPHQHRGAAELFFVLEGALDVLAGEEILSVRRGDLLVVPPGLAHAFAARPDSTADALIVITPGVERFDYFRHVVQVREGRLPRQALLDQQDRFDTYFLDSAAWASARAARDPGRTPGGH